MSIHTTLEKIKGGQGRDMIPYVHIFILILVAASAFGLGRLSLVSGSPTDSPVLISNSLDNPTTDPSLSTLKSSEKNYVASKNGKLYYTASCSGAKRIKPENQVWFPTVADAESLGYRLSSTCNK